MTTSSPAVDATRPWPVFDSHVDLVYALQRQPPPGPVAETFTRSALESGGVRVMASALYCADSYNGAAAAGHLAELVAAEPRFPGELPLIRTRADLDACWNGAAPPGRLRLLENADALLEFGVAAACAAEIVTVGLTHVGRNRLADGNAVAAPQGLTPAGRRLLAELEKAGRVVDVAHLALPGFWQVLAEFAGPLACSHTGLRHFCDQPRNLDSAQLAALFERGGMVGLAFAPGLLSPVGAATLETVFAQLDWLVQRFGAERVGIGSDFGGFDGVCTGLEEHRRLPALAARLERAGYPPGVIAGIMGENWRRFYAAVLPS